MKIIEDYSENFSGYLSLRGACMTKFGKMEIPEGYDIVMHKKPTHTIWNIQKGNA